ncbi:bursicon-like [Glandiceps talaboti]
MADIRRTLILYLFFVLQVCTSSSVESSACRRRELRYALSRPGCIPRTVVTHGCRGTCASYSMVSSDDVHNLEYFCQCCQPIQESSSKERLYCPNRHQSQRVIRVTLKSATECWCRPCTYAEP